MAQFLPPHEFQRRPIIIEGPNLYVDEGRRGYSERMHSLSTRGVPEYHAGVSIPLRNRVVVAGVIAAALLVAVPTLSHAAPLRTRKFQTPSGNIVCHLRADEPKLRCDIRSGLNPEPRRSCDFDWVGLLLSRSSGARANCASDAIPARDPAVLQYGRKWERAGRVCVSRRTGLHCWNYSGYHFKLARDDWSRWYTP